MRLKIFTADNMKAALAQVRESLGNDAIIIDSVEEENKVKITAALELPVQKTPPRKTPAPKPKPAAVQKSLKELDHADQADTKELSYFLSHHGIERTMLTRILETAASFDDDRNLTTLTRALDAMFHFNPLNNDYQDRPLMLVGPPGVGKTVTAAKLASQAVLEGRATRLINTDTVRTGGTAQLEGYGKVLKSSVIEVTEPDLLAPAIDTNHQSGELVIIDTMGYNPFDHTEMQELHQYISAYDVEPLLVISAGSDPREAEEIAATYASMGVRRFIATRLDVARRYASLLTTAGAGDLAFAGVGITPYLGKGIESVDAMHLAMLLTNIQERKIFMPPEDEISDNEEMNSPEDDETEYLIIDDEGDMK